MPFPAQLEHADESEDQLPELEASDLNTPDLLSVHPLPAHLNPRFYRSAVSRRRSSAASSRRNSLSSSQSHHSSRSYRCRQTLHSNHVAQHLRRASILEDRKARLADRAAHAEQVRLRAALAKATPRTSNSEEKALAAAQAREKYLAKVAAACAEEVSRAKRVAEENKEKRAAEERKSRLELEEKHAEAERRRQEYKRSHRRPRTTSSAEQETKKPSQRDELTEEAAAGRIQRGWRLWRRRQLLREFNDLGLSIERVGNMDFIEATALLADENLIRTSRHLMTLVGLEAPDKTTVRTFLSAFMILGHPTEIFSKHGQQEQDLINKTKELLISFEAIVSEMTSSSACKASPTLLYTLSQANATYLTAFQAWKSRDASVLIDTMVDQFVALDSIWQTVKDDTRGEVATDYKEGIRDQQVILLSKIKKLAGPDRANSMIKRAIRDSRRSRPRRIQPGDMRPRPVEASSSSSASALEQPESTNELELTDLSRVFSIVPPNRVVVHELLLDPTFTIKESPSSNVRSALNREVCESMRRGIANGETERWTVAVAENIRKRLLKVMKPGSSMHQILSEVLDADHIQNQCRQGVFSYEKFFAFMSDLLPRLCAPIRDAEVAELKKQLDEPSENSDIMIEKLFGLLHIIDLMSLDYTNYMLQQAAPTLIRESAGYEQRMFAQDLEAGVITLARTKRWWRNASVNVLTEASNGDPQGQPTFSKIYAKGLTDLAVAIGPIRDSDLPETLHLDQERLQRIRHDMLRFATVGAILLTAKNLLKRDVRSQWKPEAKRVHDCLVKSMDPNLAGRILGIIESSHGMPPSSREHLSNIISRFLTEAQNGRLQDPVLKLLFQRLRLHIYNRLAASSSSERVRVASTASESLAGIGLSEFIGQVGAISDELSKVANIDQQAHGEWYTKIMEEIEDVS